MTYPQSSKLDIWATQNVSSKLIRESDSITIIKLEKSTVQTG